MTARHFNLLVSLLLLGFASIASAKSLVVVGSPLPQLSLSDKEGGRVDGTPWDSLSARGHTTLFLYIDPDNRDDNETLQLALKNEQFGDNGLRSVAIINMAATWLPNFAIAEKMAQKQKEYPRTPQVKDLDRKGVKTWKISDDAYNVILTDKNLDVLFYKSGKLTAEEIAKVIKLIKDEMKPTSTTPLTK